MKKPRLRPAVISRISGRIRMKSLLSFTGAVVLFENGRIDIILVDPHFHLERRRVLREFPPSEMVEIEHDAKADADGI